MEVNIQNTECSLVYLSFPLLGSPLKKGARKQIRKMRKKYQVASRQTRIFLLWEEMTVRGYDGNK